MQRGKMRFDGIIFDIDGTLWDSCEAVRLSWGESLLRRYSCAEAPDLDAVRSIMGMTPDEISKKLFSSFGARAREVFDALSEDECAYIYDHGASLYPGAAETLKKLKESYRLFIVSNCQHGYIEALVHSCGFEGLFEDCLCAGVTGRDKAGNLAALISEHNIERALFIGDTRGDEEAARAAGCAFVHAAWGFGGAEAPDASAGSISELPDVIKKLEG